MTSVNTQADVAIRRASTADSPAELTALLHRAYRAQVQMGLQPLAGRQSEDVTRRRCAAGETFVAEIAGRIVGMVVLQEKEEAAFPPHFLRPGVAHFSLFAVDPDVQGRGIGRRLLEEIERRAAEIGCTELALSMAEPDAKLQEFYRRAGFGFVEFWQWPYTNYRSVILSKPIAPLPVA
ncbi:MAG: GNAT family N-acetyltransferase [Planctomycetota bacterium]|nr:GNAT family N-acetyltransferase [Planctomycetota bacterium]